MARKMLYVPRGRANETHAFVCGKTQGLYAINHAKGCSHGCKYPCYAFDRARRFEKCTYDQWINYKVYKDAPAIVARELTRLDLVSDVEMCFTTDCFMFGKDDMITTTNSLISLFSTLGIGVTVLTKGDLSRAVHAEKGWYGISLSSLDEPFRQKWEPNTAPYETRITSLQNLHEDGHKTWVSIEPFPPEKLATTQVAEIVDACRFADRMILGRWNYAGVKELDYYRSVADSFTDECRKYGIVCKVKDDIVHGA